jgi:phosphoribosylaminoimidazolecarboxamide formyltransferase/IMP cyclohydrolase
VADPAKEMIARGAEVVAPAKMANALSEMGLPVVELPLISKADFLAQQDIQLLDSRIHAGLVGDWEAEDRRQELELQGIKRIDFVLVELPRVEQVGNDLKDLLLGPGAILRSAIRSHHRVILLSDLDDFPAILQELDESGRVTLENRKRLARKALAMLCRLDALLLERSQKTPSLPRTFSMQVVRDELPVGSSGLVGLYHYPESASQVELIAGHDLTPEVLRDADRAWSLATLFEKPCVVICRNDGLCGFAQEELSAYDRVFAKARSLDPRGSFGGVAAFNSEVGAGCAKELAVAFLEAVLAPSFHVEVQALLGRSRTRLIQVKPGEFAKHSCSSLGFGFLLDWSLSRNQTSETIRTISLRQADPGQEAGLALAWRLACGLRPVSVVLADRSSLLSAGSGQTSFRDGARLAMMKMPVGCEQVQAACGSPIRFADDMNLLAEGHVAAVIQPVGSRRQTDVLARANELGMVMQVVGN